MTDAPPLKDWHTDAELLSLSVHRAVKALGGIDDDALDQLLGTGRRLDGRIEPKSASGENALLIIRAYKALYALMGGDQKSMRHWMSTFNTGTRGIPKLQCEGVKGLQIVAEYLEGFLSNCNNSDPT